MIDIHSHILPGIDDGASSVEESIRMLRQAKENNIEIIVATPHFHPKFHKDIDVYLEKRNESFELLKKAIEETGEELPKVRIGCELNVSEEISNIDLKKLCIEGTDYILTEMPYTKWTYEILDRLFYIRNNNLKLVMAHIERFRLNEEYCEMFDELDAIFQMNAGSVIDKKGIYVIDNLFKKGMVQFISSDSHNTNERANHLLEAYSVIDERYGKECKKYLERNSYRIFDDKQIERKSFKKKNFLQKLF